MELTDQQVKQIERQLNKTSKFEILELHNNFVKTKWSKNRLLVILLIIGLLMMNVGFVTIIVRRKNK